MKALGYLFFFLMLVIPTTFQAARGAFLALLTGIALTSGVKNGIRLHSWIAGLTFICVLTSLVFMTRGSFNNAPGAITVGTVYVLWPLLYLFFIGIFYKRKFWEPYLKVVVLSSLIVEAICLLLVTDGIGITNIGIINYIGFLNPLIGIYTGTIEINIPSISTLLFAIPYLVAKMLCSSEKSPDTLLWKSLERIALLGGVIVLFFIGRRALWLTVAISPIIFAVLWILSGAKLQLRRFLAFVMFGIFAGIVVTFIYAIDIKAIWDSFLTGFKFNNDDPADVYGLHAFRRKEQFQALMTGWDLNPLLGAGHGAAASDNAGLSEQAWAYELSYVALLFQVGIIGFMIYTGAVFWLYYRVLELSRINVDARLVMIPVLTGLTAFLIGNATNPYLNKFDYLWVIFLPAALLNSYLINGKLKFTQYRLHGD